MKNNKDLSEKTIDLNPFVQFGKWYDEHLASGIEIPNSVSLATTFLDGLVSLRTVLLKGYNETGFVFFTNFNSKKASQLAINPKAALLFYWSESGRQVRIEGVTEKISDNESKSYFRTRPRENQLGAWASEQSSVIPDRRYLEKQYVFYKKTFNGKSVDKPPHWGGFIIVPDWFEFWQEGKFRLHDRITYTRNGEFWAIERLAP
jgi:pyridoxamine 5'-phosphate oxidase